MSDKQSEPNVKNAVYDTSCSTICVLCGLERDLEALWGSDGISGTCKFVVSACNLTGD